ncbi:AtpZ/AtpI family protein [Albibacterium bauzanense]|uniref:Putative F0F1-ATPase subunit (Ca2+/Mg2+ transporter) n=1 Tax=Albibacterium bauzanense TaxID=653929 RepID=A0A4V2PXU0_9SPHI|nr:AtpZ/AtpI family protein [Albibacterium bauzanense]TCK83401.1 putative F0F1-ATPase subunit (Ca2+/Mg2+ transporter) [Albibacterium bauzanense]
MAFFKRSSNQKEDENNLSKYAYYSGLGFQMIAIIGVFTFIGYKIDQNMDNQKPVFTAILSLLGVCVSLYSVIKSVKKQ